MPRNTHYGMLCIADLKAVNRDGGPQGGYAGPPVFLPLEAATGGFAYMCSSSAEKQSILRGLISVAPRAGDGAVTAVGDTGFGMGTI